AVEEAALAGREIVVADDAMAVAKQPIGEVAADEAGGARDEALHGAASLAWNGWTSGMLRGQDEAAWGEAGRSRRDGRRFSVQVVELGRRRGGGRRRLRLAGG